MGNLLDSLFPEEGQLARLRAAVTGQGATPERLFSTGQEPDRFAGAPVGNSSVYPQERVSVPTGDLLSPREARVAAFKQNPVTNALIDAATPLGTIAGVGAKLVDHAALRRAQQLEASGALPETIWKATGFHRDKAGNWLWEIDDSGMQIKAYDQRTGNASDPPGFYQRDAGGTSLAGDTLRTHFPAGTKVGDVVEHPELFANYPHLAGLPLKDNPWAFDLLGSYNPANKAVTLNIGKPDKIPDTAVHELSHAVQHFEELPFGGMPQLPKDFKANSQFANEMKRTLEGQLEKWLPNQLQMPQQDIGQMLWGIEHLMKGNKLSQRALERIEKFKQQAPELYATFVTAAQDTHKFRQIEQEAYEKYRALHGEQTANAAGARVNLSPYQRRERPFWRDYTLPESNHLMGDVEFWTP